MSIAVLWIETWIEDSGLAPFVDRAAQFKEFNDTQLAEALNFAAEKRKDAKCSHVVINTELADNVGKPGVNSVENGKTPDGHDYEWSKQHRGGPPRKD